MLAADADGMSSILRHGGVVQRQQQWRQAAWGARCRRMVEGGTHAHGVGGVGGGRGEEGGGSRQAWYLLPMLLVSHSPLELAGGEEAALRG